MKNNGIIIYGPQGCGKTTITEAFLVLFNGVCKVKQYDSWADFVDTPGEPTVVLFDGVTDLPNVSEISGYDQIFVIVSNLPPFDKQAWAEHFTILDFEKFMGRKDFKKPAAPRKPGYVTYNGVPIYNDTDYKNVITLFSDFSLEQERIEQQEDDNEDAMAIIEGELRSRKSSESLKLSDEVSSPAHYIDGNIEVIDFIEDKQLDFHLGNVVKYVSHAGKKDPNKEIQDLEKAAWYLQRKIENLKKLQ